MIKNDNKVEKEQRLINTIINHHFCIENSTIENKKLRPTP
jgi:hypothetical protein